MIGAGFLYTHDSADAAVVIVNTCAFIEAAVQESIDTILDYRAENERALIVVAGCLPLRYRESLKEALAEADLFITPDQIQQLPQILATVHRKSGRPALAEHQMAAKRSRHSCTSVAEAGGEKRAPAGSAAAEGPARVLTTPGYAYLRISEGCSRRCKYCTIPSIRGPLRSADPNRLEEEARCLSSWGARELILVAQDLTAYGLDLEGKKALTRLVKRLSRVPAVQWIRLMYLHPDSLPRGLTQLMRESDRLLPYLDVPIQHVSPKVLKAMGRPWKGDRIRRLFDRLRDEVSGLVLRTTLMVGYPEEGEREFRELRDFLASYEIEHVGVFTYSPEEGTPAYELGDPVPAAVKHERAEELRKIHSKHTRARNRQRIGAVESCMVQGLSDETDLLLAGRTWDQAPEIDGMLYITAGSASVGEIRNVLITAAHGPDLFGELV